MQTTSISSDLNGAAGLRDMLSTVDLRFAERSLGEPVEVTTPEAAHRLMVKTQYALCYLQKMPRQKYFIALGDSVMRLNRHPNLTALQHLASLRPHNVVVPIRPQGAA